MERHKELLVIAFEDAGAWKEWLKENHAASGSIWINFAKKGSGVASVNYEQAREGALIYGWIDGLLNKYDDHFYLIRFSPRKPKGTWSKINCEIVEKLIEAGQMHPAGLAQVETAKKDGRWENAYDSPSKMSVSADFQEQLDLNPQAKTSFEGLNRANRYAFLYRIQTAKSPAARTRAIQKAIEVLNANRVPHPKS